MTNLGAYLHQFSHLHTNKNRTSWTAVTTHRAPHKPLLLLAVLDLFAQGSITTNLIALTPELSELFTLYWHKVRPPNQRKQRPCPCQLNNCHAVVESKDLTGLRKPVRSGPPGNHP
ncbi:MAG: hypothetical protein KBE23_21730 [Chloroflexi bacterium]|nr:hypothetical protein [Chloroflexota bacterium]